MVTYEVTSDIKGRLRAVDVQFVGDRYEVSTNSRGIFLVIPSLFVATITGLVVTERLPVVVLVVYLIASVVSFVVYAGDKAASKIDGWRTAESWLHLLSLLGGWPGAFVAQRVLRHKSKKGSFQIGFWATVVVNCIGLVWLLSPLGTDALTYLFNLTDYHK